MSLVSNWRRVLRHAWSIRFIIGAGVLAGAEAALPLVQEVLPVPRGWLAAGSRLHRSPSQPAPSLPVSSPSSRCREAAMPINKIIATKRGKAAIAAALMAAAVASYQAVQMPAAVILTTAAAPWTGP
ncbi:hypothetical protein [Bosea sp. (in: a-proteobacteria)]|uniref:DUF7940 domain-containing protein n=1 Tax=Bosea sp. (in: a-proteobacteria) TaxID=1871050 RepID=UPI0025C04CB3|nr:hypothetical protein [Bosea sp. (in: a-proteobacteria)]